MLGGAALRAAHRCRRIADRPRAAGPRARRHPPRPARQRRQLPQGPPAAPGAVGGTERRPAERRGRAMAAAKAGARPDVCAQDGDGFCAGDDGSGRRLDRPMVRARRRAPPVDVAAEMAKVTLDVVERTIFSDGFGSDAEDIRMAMATYFNTIGKISALDILGVPDFVPRLSRFRVRSTLQFFEAEVDRVISARRRILAEQPDRAPNDLLTHLLESARHHRRGRSHRSRGALEHPDLHRRRSRNHREHPELGPVPALPIAGMARAGRGRGGPRADGIGGRRHRRSPDRNPRGDRGNHPPVSADIGDQPRRSR